MHEFRCRAILFDLDGVLVDSTACIERHWTRWATQHGLDPALVIRAAHGRPTVETMREVAPHLAAEEETARLEAAEASDTGGVMAFSGAAELLRSLPEGSWAVATSGTRRTATNRLAQTGLPTPKVLVTADDIRQGKPHPEPYLLAAKGLGLAAEDCLVVEDAPPRGRLRAGRGRSGRRRHHLTPGRRACRGRRDRQRGSGSAGRSSSRRRGPGR